MPPTRRSTPPRPPAAIAACWRRWRSRRLPPDFTRPRSLKTRSCRRAMPSGPIAQELVLLAVVPDAVTALDDRAGHATNRVDLGVVSPTGPAVIRAGPTHG